jgi:hypothetical protein
MRRHESSHRQNRRSAGDLKPGYPKYEAEVFRHQSLYRLLYAVTLFAKICICNSFKDSASNSGYSFVWLHNELEEITRKALCPNLLQAWKYPRGTVENQGTPVETERVRVEIPTGYLETTWQKNYSLSKLCRWYNLSTHYSSRHSVCLISRHRAFR